MSTEDELVTVYTVNDPLEAEVIKNALHEEGIACEINDEHQAGFTGMFEIGVLVRARDADRAHRIIASHEPRAQHE